MIENTQRKLREARYFLNLLDAENRKTMRNESEAFDFLLSAFLSAARSVTFVLQKEEKEKYDAWFSGWRLMLNEDNLQLMSAMSEHRNEELKKDGVKHRVEWQYVDVSTLTSDELCGEVSYCEYPGIPRPRIGRPIRYLKQADVEREALAACKEYYRLLKQLVEAFLAEHITQGT